MCALLQSCFLNLIVLCIMTKKAFNSVQFNSNMHQNFIHHLCPFLFFVAAPMSV